MKSRREIGSSIRLYSLVQTLCAGVIFLGGFVAHAGAPSLATGFSRVAIPSGHGAGELTDFAFLPASDGSTSKAFLSLSRAGAVTFVDANGNVHKIGQIPNIFQAEADLGLVGISLAPDFLTSKQIALTGVYNASPAPVGQVDIYVLDSALNPTALMLVRNVIGGISQNTSPTGGGSHGPGTVVWANDNTLFAGFGDAADWGRADPLQFRALDPDDPHGKILHVNADGSAVSTNPYYSSATPGSWRQKVFALGFRNPFRFSADPTRTNVLYVGDVGRSDYEKLMIVRAGTVAGWPCFEGVDGKSGFKNPESQDLPQCLGYYNYNAIYQIGTMVYKETISAPTAALWNFNRQNAGGAIVGGAFYTGNNYPSTYKNSYFFGNYPPDSPSKIFTLKTDGTSLIGAVDTGFGTSIGGPVAFRAGPGGDIFYADNQTGSVFQIRYSPGNRAPEVNVITTVNATTKTVCFDASTSTDLDGDSLTGTVAYGDGAVGIGLQSCHVYAAGSPSTTFTAVVTVTDRLGAASSKNLTVLPANNLPTIVPTNVPSVNAKFRIGQAIAFQMKAGDVEDGPQSVSARVDLIHCATESDCHTHTATPTVVSPNAAGDFSFQTTFVDHGLNTSELITFTTKDRLGSQVSWSYKANPDQRTLTIDSPAPVTVAGVSTTSIRLTVGSVNTVSVPLKAGYLTFTGWSDGGANAHDIVMPDANLTLTARYATAIDQYYASVSGVLGAPTGPEVSVGANGRVRTYANGNIYWSEATGARMVRSGNLAKYTSIGGPSSLIGFPKTDERAVPGGTEQLFETGNMYNSTSAGSVVVRGSILFKYSQMGGANSYLGLPKEDSKDLAGGGAEQLFQNGRIEWTIYTGPVEIHEPVQGEYVRNGGPTGFLGFPTSDAFMPTGNTIQQNFTGGIIVWSAATGAREIHDPTLAEYNRNGGITGFLGLPISAGYIVSSYGIRQDFQQGSIIWSAATGAREIHDPIKAKYDSLGAQTSFLGYPTSAGFMPNGNTIQQNFQNGHSISWTAAGGYVVR